MLSRISIALFAALVGSTLASPAVHAAPIDSVEVRSAASESESVDFFVQLDHAVAPLSWARVGTWRMSAKATEDSALIAHFEGEPYTATFKIRATYQGENYGHEYWNLTVTRYNTVGDKLVSRSKPSVLKLQKNGPSIRLVSSGSFAHQFRNLSLTFKLD